MKIMEISKDTIGVIRIWGRMVGKIIKTRDEMTKLSMIHRRTGGWWAP